jgi:RNA polymerase sigma-70 factor (ECF subfamily)
MANESGQISMIASEITWCEALAGVAGAAPARVRDDAELVEEFLRSGDDEPFAVLVQRYKDRVFRLVVSILGPTAEAEAEDLVQEIFITVYRKLDAFRGDSSFSTWLYRLSRNRAIDGLRRRRSFAVVAGERPEGDAEPRCAIDLQTEIERSGRSSLVLRHVDRLGEPRRTVVFLHYWMGCGVDEISCLTEIPIGTVKSHLYRARRELAKRLSREAING